MQPAGDAWTPGTTLPAEGNNWALQQPGLAASDLLTHIGNVAALNWSTVDATPSFAAHLVGFVRAAWDGYAKTIRLLALNNGGTAAAGETSSISYDGGRTFAASTETFTEDCYSYAANPATGGHCFCTPTSTPALGTVSGVATGSWTMANSVWFAGAGLIVNAGINGGTQRMNTTDGTAAVTDRSSQVPASMLTSATDVVMVQSPTTLLIFGNKTSGSGGNNYLSTTDGVTFATCTSPISGSFKLTAAVHDGAVFIVAATDGTDTKIYTSATGTGSWTLVATLTGKVIKGMAASGRALFASLYAGTRARGWVSSDSGATWKCRGSYACSTSGDAVISVHDGEGFFASTPGGVRFSASFVTGS